LHCNHGWRTTNVSPNGSQVDSLASIAYCIGGYRPVSPEGRYRNTSRRLFVSKSIHGTDSEPVKRYSPVPEVAASHFRVSRSPECATMPQKREKHLRETLRIWPKLPIAGNVNGIEDVDNIVVADRYPSFHSLITSALKRLFLKYRCNPSRYLLLPGPSLSASYDVSS